MGLGRYITATAIIAILASTARAQTLVPVPYRAHLEKNGVPVDQELSIGFSLHTSVEGGDQVWPVAPGAEVQTVAVIRGALMAQLLIPIKILDVAKPLFLQAMIGQTLLGGRQQLLPVPRAASAQNSPPVGTVIAWPGALSTIPDGWLVADGREVAIADYPELYDLFGGRYDTTSDVNHFQLPDLRSRFLRGTPAQPSAGRNVGDVAPYTTANPKVKKFVVTTAELAHTHVFIDTRNADYHFDDANDFEAYQKTVPSKRESMEAVWTTTDPEIVVGDGDSETCPAHVYVYWIVRARSRVLP